MERRRVFAIRLTDTERAAVAAAAAGLGLQTGTLIRTAAVAVAAELVNYGNGKAATYATQNEG